MPMPDGVRPEGVTAGEQKHVSSAAANCGSGEDAILGPALHVCCQFIVLAQHDNSTRLPKFGGAVPVCWRR